MEIKDFVKNFAAQFDETDESMFAADTKFRELDEWSSLIGLSVMAMVGEEYGITLKSDDIRASETIQDLFEIVKGKM